MKFDRKPSAGIAWIFLVSGFAILAIAAATLLWPTGDSQTDQIEGTAAGFGSYASPPETLDAFAAELSMVVTGTYTRIIGEDERDVPGEAKDRGHSPGLPVTYLEFEVDRYVVGDGPETLAVTWHGDPIRDMNLRFDELITLIAALWPDDPAVFYPVSGYGNLWEIDGRVAYAFVDEDTTLDNQYFHAPPPFAEDMTMDDFHETLREAARERGLVVPD